MNFLVKSIYPKCLYFYNNKHNILHCIFSLSAFSRYDIFIQYSVNQNNNFLIIEFIIILDWTGRFSQIFLSY